LIQREGVGRVCTDHSADTLQRLAVELADEIASGKSVSARCRALSAKLFSPEAAVRQIVAALGGSGCGNSVVDTQDGFQVLLISHQVQ